MAGHNNIISGSRTSILCKLLLVSFIVLWLGAEISCKYKQQPQQQQSAPPAASPSRKKSAAAVVVDFKPASSSKKLAARIINLVNEDDEDDDDDGNNDDLNDDDDDDDDRSGSKEQNNRGGRSRLGGGGGGKNKWTKKGGYDSYKGGRDSDNGGEVDDYDSIEDVTEDRIDEILCENDKNLLVFFYDRENKCSACKSALDKLEEVDDDLEALGYVEVVKSRNRRLAREFGIYNFPAMVYLRRKNPVLYDGAYDSSEELYRWVRAHDQIATIDLDDGNFEDKTDSYSPNSHAMDWFILFYDAKKIDCNSYVPAWEAAAYHLRGLINVAKIDVHESDDVAQRFNIDDEDDCPTFILFRKGKMYRYRESARDVKSYINFALQKYKESRGRRVPEPPTMVEELYEQIKEYLIEKSGEHTGSVALFGVVAFSCFTVLCLLCYCRMRRKSKVAKDDGAKKNL